MYLLGTLSMRDADEIAEAHENYAGYLETVRDNMPSDAFTFASASWHYNPEDHRCPHDSWLQKLTIDEAASGARSEVRSVDISVRLLGAYQDGWIDLTYSDVTNYSLGFTQAGSSTNQGHGDWLIDEVRMSDRMQVIHEVVFSTGARWLIECRNVRCGWTERSRLAS
jgi:hypothetical protein